MVVGYLKHHNLALFESGTRQIFETGKSGGTKLKKARKAHAMFDGWT
jgi:hypothetical protein